MKEPNSKIVDFESRRKKSEDISPEEFIMNEYPPEVSTQLVDIEKHVAELNIELEKTLSKFRDDKGGGPMDISIPLEALARTTQILALDLDRQVLPEVLDDHMELRMDIAKAVNETIGEFFDKRDTPVYSHDIYIGILVALQSYIQQHRVFSIMKSALNNPEE